MATLPDLLRQTLELDASDLHLTAGSPPQVRVHGELQRLDMPDLTPSETKAFAYSVLTDVQKKRFEETLELDLSSASAAWRASAATCSTSGARWRRPTA